MRLDWCHGAMVAFFMVTQIRNLIHLRVLGGSTIPWSIWVFFTKNMGILPPKSSIKKIGVSIINHPFWDTTIFGNTPFSEFRHLNSWGQETSWSHRWGRRRPMQKHLGHWPTSARDLSFHNFSQSIIPNHSKYIYIYIGYIPTPLTVNKMVCFYFYHPGGAPRFSWFSCVFIWWYFWCVLMCSCVLFLVRFSRVFCRAFSGVFWWFCWWYFLCFSWCFFHCVLVFFSVLFFVFVPFLFYIRFFLVVVLFFAVLFFVVFGCFFRVFFRAFCGVFFVSFIVLFFVHFFVLFLVFFFEFCFFVPWVAPETNNHNILHFGPCFFRCFFWWSLLVKIGYTQYIYTRIYIYINLYKHWMNIMFNSG